MAGPWSPRPGGERRIDPSDGKSYTKAEFVEEYGGYREWDMADPRGRKGGRNRDRGPPQLNEWGHNYSRMEDDTEVIDDDTLEKINSMIRDRFEAKLEREFDKADALRDELKDDFGVQVNDGRKVWRADGQSFDQAPQPSPF